MCSCWLMQDQCMQPPTFLWSIWPPGLWESSWVPPCWAQAKCHWTTASQTFTTQTENAVWGGCGGSRGEVIHTNLNRRLIAVIWAAQLMLPSSSLPGVDSVFLTFGLCLFLGTKVFFFGLVLGFFYFDLVFVFVCYFLVLFFGGFLWVAVDFLLFSLLKKIILLSWLCWRAHDNVGKWNPEPALPPTRSWCSWRLPGLCSPRRTRMTSHAMF